MSTARDNLLARAKQGVESINLPEEIKHSALANFGDWLGTDKLAGLVPRSDYGAIMRWMVEAEKFDLLIDSFYQVIPFGTGGRRGPVGVGPNRINPYTIASSVQGHVEYLRQRFGEAERLRVVIANDVRAFHDIRGTYPNDLENPLLGLSSRDFARIAATVYSSAGVEVYALPSSDGGYISTPELSFLIRWVGAQGGINVSASHNHPDDNGSKFYNGEGGQEIPPDDERTCGDRRAEVKEPSKQSATDATAMQGRTWSKRCLAKARQCVHRHEPRAYACGHTPGRAAKLRLSLGLHGIGVEYRGALPRGRWVLPRNDQLFYVEEQCEFRSDFKFVTFRSPNPGGARSPWQRGIQLAGRGRRRPRALGDGSQTLTDLGGAARDRRRLQPFVSGNEFAAILDPLPTGIRWRLPDRLPEQSPGDQDRR